MRSLAWADEVLVFDSFSQDETVPLAEAAGATVLQSPFENYAQQRNAALEAVQTDWVFFVDADERGTPELAAEIRRRHSRANRDRLVCPAAQYHFRQTNPWRGLVSRLPAAAAAARLSSAFERPVHETGV